MQRQFAKNDRTGPAQGLNHIGITLCHMAQPDLGMAARNRPCNIDNVLYTDGDPMQGPPAPPGKDFLLSQAGSLENLVGINTDEGMERRVQFCYSLQQTSNQLYRRQASLDIGSADFRCRQPMHLTPLTKI
ncbi:hypothetical protein CDEF62S_05516 [Castellaniella defragrans]